MKEKGRKNREKEKQKEKKNDVNNEIRYTNKKNRRQ
jgi:hypothetical protein